MSRRSASSPHRSRDPTLCHFINQIRMKIASCMQPETTTGGNALKFYASVRLDIRRIDQSRTMTKSPAIRPVKVVKNKVAPPSSKSNSTSCMAKRFEDGRTHRSRREAASSRNQAPGFPMTASGSAKAGEFQEFPQGYPQVADRIEQASGKFRPYCRRILDQIDPNR